MSVSSPPQIRLENRLLAAIPREEYDRLLPLMEAVSLDLKQILYQPNERIEYVYFPINGAVSLVTIMKNGIGAEVGLVGNEGMVGLAVFLKADRTVGQAITQIPGHGLKMKAEVFKREVTSSSPLYNRLQRYTQALFDQIAQTSGCNRMHSIEQRFCRWMLMCQDRMGSDQFPLTQEFLAQMLSVRRAGVSEIASVMQKAGLIQYNRGKMTILNRKRLETSSCECYAIIKQQFDRLLDGDSGQ